MFKYSLKKEKYHFFPILSGDQYFQYFWSKHFVFKLRFFSSLVIIFNFICLVLLLLQFFLYESITTTRIAILSCFAILFLLVNSFVLLVIFQKNKQNLFVNKIQMIFIIFSFAFNWLSFFAFGILLVLADETFALPYSIFFPFGILSLLSLFYSSFIIVTRIKLSNYSYNTPNTILIYKNSNLDSNFVYINLESGVWNKDETIFSNPNVLIQYYGVGIYKKRLYDCLYIFKINNEYLFVDFCSISNTLVSKNNKSQLEQKLISEALKILKIE